MSALNNAIKDNVEAYDKQIAKAIDIMLDSAFDYLGKLKLKNGKIAFTAENMRYAASLSGSWTNALNEAGFSQANTDLINKYDSLIAEMIKVRPDYAVPLNLTGASVEQIDALKILNNQAFNLIGDNAMSSLQSLVINSVTTQIPLSELIEEFRSTLDSRLARYAKTYALTSQQMYVQKIEDISAEAYAEEGGVLYWEYVGPEDDLTRPECHEALAWGAVDDATKETFQAETEPRYNCRHIWQQVTNNRFEKKKVDNGSHELPNNLVRNK